MPDRRGIGRAAGGDQAAGGKEAADGTVYAPAGVDAGADADAGAGVKVVYLAGWGRNGSTILGSALGGVPGWLPIGDLRYLFEPGMICSCGEPTSMCPLWSAVLDRAKGQLGAISEPEVWATARRGLAPKHVPSVLHKSPTGVSGRVQGTLLAVYRALAAEAGIKVIVDGSKRPTEAALLGSCADLSLVHLIRDPRATAFSWSHRRRMDQDAMGTAQSTGRWIEWNVLTELVARRLPADRVLRLRYEDFVADPQDTLARIVSLVDDEPCPPLVVDGSAKVPPNHMLYGHPGRFRTGQVPLRLDDIWDQEMPALERNLITGAAWPLMLRYGYLGTGRAAGSRGRAPGPSRQSEAAANGLGTGRRSTQSRW